MKCKRCLRNVASDFCDLVALGRLFSYSACPHCGSSDFVSEKGRTVALIHRINNPVKNEHTKPNLRIVK